MIIISLMRHRKITLLVAIMINAMILPAQKFYWASDDGPTNYSTTYIFETAVDSRNEVVVFGTVGSTFDNKNNRIQNDSSYNYFLAKYTSEGDVIWYKALGANGYIGNVATEVAMVVSDDDKIYVGAKIPYGRAINVDGTTMEYTGSGGTSDEDFFVARFDQNGNRELVFSQGADAASVHAIDVDAIGNIYLAGSYSGDIDFETIRTSAGLVDAFLAKFDADGNAVWSRSEGNPSNSDLSYDVEVNGADIYWGYYLRLGTDYFTVVDKVSTNNDFSWNYTAYGTESGYSNVGAGLAVVNSDIYLLGSFRTEIALPTSVSNITLTTTAGNSQLFVAKIRDFGSTRGLIWAEQEGGTSYDSG